MAITTAAELQVAVGNWANRTDLTDRFGEFVVLAEAKFNRRLRVRAMESTLASTPLVSGAISLPSSFLAFKELRYDGSPSWTLEPRPLEWLQNQSASADSPLYFAVTGSQVVCWPTSGSVKGTYYTSLSSLASNTSNWLLASAPDLYLFGCLEQVGIYLRDPALTELGANQTEMLLQQVQGADNANALNGGPLVARAR